jgi:hypothetical protein
VICSTFQESPPQFAASFSSIMAAIFDMTSRNLRRSAYRARNRQRTHCAASKIVDIFAAQLCQNCNAALISGVMALRNPRLARVEANHHPVLRFVSRRVTPALRQSVVIMDSPPSHVRHPQRSNVWLPRWHGWTLGGHGRSVHSAAAFFRRQTGARQDTPGPELETLLEQNPRRIARAG